MFSVVRMSEELPDGPEDGGIHARDDGQSVDDDSQRRRPAVQSGEQN